MQACLQDHEVVCITMPQHRCGKLTHVPTLYDFVTDAQIAQVQPFSSPQEVFFGHQGFKCSQCQVQKATTCVTCFGQAGSLRLMSSSGVQVW